MNAQISNIKAQAIRVLDFLREILKGEPARAIGYGAGAILYGVAAVSGNIPDVSLDQAILQAGLYVAAFASIVETIRKFVYSENSVQSIATSAAASGDDTIPPPPANADAGLDT